MGKKRKLDIINSNELSSKRIPSTRKVFKQTSETKDALIANKKFRGLTKTIEDGILEMFVIFATWLSPWFMSLCYVSESLLILLSPLYSVKGALKCIAMMWTRYLSLWHNHSIVGLHNIPTKGPGLIVWYHGPVPVDYIGLVARVYLETNRRMYSVVDKCLHMLPFLDMFRTHMRVGSFSKVKIAGLLEEGELVGVAPGGGRECLFDPNLSVMWNKRTGFAKVAGLTQVPIIPVYTENIRLAYKTMSTGESLFRAQFEFTKIPCIPMYGGFPIKLTTFIGNPMFVKEGESPLELQSRVRLEVKKMVAQYQIEKDVLSALEERYSKYILNSLKAKGKKLLKDCL